MSPLSPKSTTESNLNIKEMSPRRRSMMISKCRKVWAWLNGPRETPLRDHDKITIYYQLVMHPVSGEYHVTPWRSTNLDRKGKYALVWHRCMVDRKIWWPQIIYHQMCNPNHPYAQLNRVQTSKRCLPEEKAWWYLNINQISNTCPIRGYWRQHLIPWP